MSRILYLDQQNAGEKSSSSLSLSSSSAVVNVVTAGHSPPPPPADVQGAPAAAAADDSIRAVVDVAAAAPVDAAAGARNEAFIDDTPADSNINEANSDREEIEMVTASTTTDTCRQRPAFGVTRQPSTSVIDNEPEQVRRKYSLLCLHFVNLLLVFGNAD